MIVEFKKDRKIGNKIDVPAFDFEKIMPNRINYS
jgi:hypothetical protein